MNNNIFQRRMKLEKNPLVSIIIPTYNSEKYLQECISSLKNQKYKKIEIIVVDQSSNDQTQEIAKKEKVKILVVKKPKFYTPPSASRNRGFEVSKGSIIFNMDSDMSVPKNLIEEFVTRFSSDETVGALVVHESDKTKGYWSRCKALERKCYWGNDNIESARVVRRDVFERVNGYDEKLSSGEDFDIHKRYKEVTGVGFCKNVLYHNVGELSFSRMVLKKFNYGKTAQRYFKKNQTSGFSLMMEQFKCYIKNYKLFLKSPSLGFGVIFLKISEFGAGGIGSILK